MDLELARRKVDKLLAKHRHAVATVKAERAAILEAKDQLAEAQTAQQVVQAVAQTVQQQAHTRIASIVTKCLAGIFDDPYEFRIIFDRKRGKTEARLVFYRDGKEFDPTGSTGGGCVEVAAFALRVSCILLSRPPGRRVVILDEPFRNVHSPIYRQRVCQMVERLAKDLGMQFVIVTGIRDFEIGHIIRIGDG